MFDFVEKVYSISCFCLLRIIPVIPLTENISVDMLSSQDVFC